MVLQLRTWALALVAAVSTLLAASSSQAYFTICNKSGETIFLLYVVPKTSCASGQGHDLLLIADGACHQIYDDDARGKHFYYRGWAQDPGSTAFWGSDIDVWIPNQSTNGCIPDTVCRLREGQGKLPGCKVGKIYRMRDVVPGSANTTMNLR